MLPSLLATRYVTPLREGGSVPAIVECNDDGLYVMKLRGAAQGLPALVAEVLCLGLARALELPVPNGALVTLDAALGRAERDTEIRELLTRSVGLNFALDWLPGSITFDPVVPPVPDAELASRIVWFDAFITNPDRTARNPNLLVWHRKLWLIDHGASLYFQHGWSAPVRESALEAAQSPFKAVKDHVLLPWATKLNEVSEGLRAKLTDAVLDAIVDDVPLAWLEPGQGSPFTSAVERQSAWREFLRARVQAVPTFVAEAVRARS